MKNIYKYKLYLVLAFMILLIGTSAYAAKIDLENIGISKAGDSIVVSITCSNPVEFKSMLTEQTPERIVIDLKGVVNNWPEKNFSKLPCKSISRIRTSQYQVVPDSVSRVVLDIGRPIDFRTYKQGNEIIVKIPAVRDEIEFAAWKAQGGSQTVASKPAEKPATITKVPESTPMKTPPVEEKKPVKTAEAPTPKTEEKPAAQIETAPKIQEPEKLSEEAEPPASAGVRLDTTPVRKIVAYEVGDIRDPFLPLIKSGGRQPGEGLPVLENLKLVGIMEDLAGNMALLEDAEGNGYILRANDKIRNGYVVTVTESKAIFQVTEYGWTRTVALELQIPVIK